MKKIFIQDKKGNDLYMITFYDNKYYDKMIKALKKFKFKFNFIEVDGSDVLCSK